jgi:hypothetical protein
VSGEGHICDLVFVLPLKVKTGEMWMRMRPPKVVGRTRRPLPWGGRGLSLSFLIWVLGMNQADRRVFYFLLIVSILETGAILLLAYNSLENLFLIYS